MPKTIHALPLHARSGALLALALVLTACSNASPSPSATPAGASGAPSGSPTSSGGNPASPGPTVGAIEHLTGATDVVLRIEQGGGFVPMEFQATNAPGFTLYGNGVVVFQPTVSTFPEPDANGVARLVPWRTGRLDETQVQELLEFALTNGGLGTARDAYLANGIADAPNTIFTIHAGGIDKTVVVNALSEESKPGPDTLARSAFLRLAKRLQDFDQGGTIPADVYQADRFRGVLIARDDQPGTVTIGWPWAALDPADFEEGPPDNPGLPHRTLTATEIAELKLENIAGGVQGIVLKAPDGKLYSFILRPLLGDERE
ncbi:MAG: hypothetical protein ABIZ72_04590 [Candidatus Limnocylindrales bacterium]